MLKGSCITPKDNGPFLKTIHQIKSRKLTEIIATQ